MEAERIRADRLRERFDFVRAHRSGLIQAEVREHDRRRRRFAYAIRRGELRAPVHRSLATEAERDAVPLGELGEVAIDDRRFRGPARHPGDEERRAEPLADERHFEIDVVERELGKRVVHELDFFEERRLRGMLDVRTLAEVEVRALAPLDSRVSHPTASISRTPRGSTPTSSTAAPSLRHASRAAARRPGSKPSAITQSPPTAPELFDTTPQPTAARASSAI